MSRAWIKLVVVAGVMASLQTGVRGVDADPPEWRGGAAAIEHLGSRLPSVAAANGLSTASLRTHLLTDGSLRVDTDDRLLYVDPARVAASSPATSWLDGTGTTTATFTEHSKPGSARTIYLDFGGRTISGTAWNTSAVGESCYTDAYNADGAAGFSSEELKSIYSIWQRVAEDYAPFDVDVTLELPAEDAITRSSSTDDVYGTRVLITNSTSTCPGGKTFYSAICTSGCGGVAYVGVFGWIGSGASTHSYYQPALVFQNGTGPGAKFVAEAVSHEAGHNLGLSHDGTSLVGYYEGHGSWAPIMGVGYYKAITQWSKGEYVGANNTQDDFSVMGQNGAGPRADEPSTSLVVGTPFSGVVSTAADADSFTLSLAKGQKVTITATPASTSPDLDIRLTVSIKVKRSSMVVSDDPPSGSSSGDISTGMGATITLTAANAATYTVKIEGVGYGSPLTTGYSDYASVGGYTISVTNG